MRNLLIFASLYISTLCPGQELTGGQLLELAISYHDPDNNWVEFQDKFRVTMSTPGGNERVSDIEIDLQGDFFQLTALKNDIKIQQSINKGSCSILLNDAEDFSEEDKQKYRLTCERAEMMRNYYTYLYGLPMKLKDPGTMVHPEVSRRKFKGQEYLVLKVSYEKEVGEDSWYFYFDPKTYAMKVYQFFHDESKNDGEYILLTEEEVISGIRMPKIRAWFYNKDDKYLGTDILTP